MRALLRFLLFLFILVAGVAAVAIYWTFYKPLPDHSATIHLPGLESPADIHWDPFGVPHIYAGHKRDLYYAIGYVHAQDRLWQMTLSQLSAEGRFAEFLGEDLIALDKYQRTLGFWETARRIEREAPVELLELLQAYADGVNDFVRKSGGKLPIEFSLLGIEPIPWTPAHSFAISRLMAWEMNTGWWSKMTFGYLSEHLPENMLRELIPEWGSGEPVMMRQWTPPGAAAWMAPLLDREMEMRALSGREGSLTGSNAWAVSGSRTESGSAILAGDPHLGLSMPGYWYELHLSLDGRTLTGATIPGAPMVVLGQNSHYAWSLTNMMADDTDFFVGLPHPDRPDHYLLDSLDGTARYAPFEKRDEVIRVRGGADHLYRVRSTRHGPVISDIYPEKELTGEYLISMAWTGHRVSQEILALHRINWGEDFDTFLEALRDFRSPGQNFAYADREGNIAIISAAGLPIRSHNPLLFRKGWDSSYDWQGWIPFEELPRVINPESGFVANANNKLHPNNYPHYITAFWEPPSRIQRIEEYFRDHPVMSVELFRQMQFDSYSVHARELVERILPALRQSGAAAEFSEILPYLQNWNYLYEGSSTAATLLDAFFIKLTRNTLLDELGETAYRTFIRKHNMPVRVMNRLLQDDSFLFKDQSTGTIETREQMIVRSMQDAVEWLTSRYGEEPINWRWENHHTIRLRPPLFSEASDRAGAPAPLRLIVNNLMTKGPYPVDGHSMSINNGQYDWSRPFEMVAGPSIRRIVDFSTPHRSYSVLPTGQSGNPLSEFYGDQTDLWLNGQYRYIYQDSTFFRETSYQTMRLLPDRERRNDPER